MKTCGKWEINNNKSKTESLEIIIGTIKINNN